MTQCEKALRHWRVAFLFWFFLLTIATHLPQPTPTGDPVFESPDKLLHFVSFGMLGYLFMCSGLVRNVIFSWFIIAMWAVVDEYTQDMLPLNRPFSSEDLIAGELGILSAYAWHGALQSPQLEYLQKSIERVLSCRKNWFYVGGIGAVTAVCMTGVWWFAIRELQGEQNSNLAFAAGIEIAVIAMVTALCVLGNIQLHRIDVFARQKNLVLLLFVSMGIPTMIIFMVPHTYVDPWVLALFANVLGARVAWNFSI